MAFSEPFVGPFNEHVFRGPPWGQRCAGPWGDALDQAGREHQLLVSGKACTQGPVGAQGAVWGDRAQERDEPMSGCCQTELSQPGQKEKAGKCHQAPKGRVLPGVGQ